MFGRKPLKSVRYQFAWSMEEKLKNWDCVTMILMNIYYVYAWQLKQTSESSIISTELDETDSFSTVYCIAFTAGFVRR